MAKKAGYVHILGSEKFIFFCEFLMHTRCSNNAYLLLVLLLLVDMHSCKTCLLITGVGYTEVNVTKYNTYQDYALLYMCHFLLLLIIIIIIIIIII